MPPIRSAARVRDGRTRDQYRPTIMHRDVYEKARKQAEIEKKHLCRFVEDCVLEHLARIKRKRDRAARSIQPE
jgi:hypothetical protein